jgi:hypothetical protein
VGLPKANHRKHSSSDAAISFRECLRFPKSYLMPLTKAPKGRDNLAQGKRSAALGTSEANPKRALKGRHARLLLETLSVQHNMAPARAHAGELRDNLTSRSKRYV